MGVAGISVKLCVSRVDKGRARYERGALPGQTVLVIRRKTQLVSARVPAVKSTRDLENLTSRTRNSSLFISSSSVIRILAVHSFLADKSYVSSIIACACRTIYWQD